MGIPRDLFVSTAQTHLVGIPAAVLNVLMCFLQSCPGYCGELVAPTPPPFSDTCTSTLKRLVCDALVGK